MNWLALDGLNEPPGGWLGALRDAGYDGVQMIEPLPATLADKARDLGLEVCGSGRVNLPADAWRLARQARRLGLGQLTIHLGWGLEDEAEGLALIDAVLEASDGEGVSMHVETHRATLFQDIWRTVRFVEQRPELRFTADLSHWYTGLEFVYGGIDRKLAFISPVLDRVDSMHGRIGDPGCMQVDIGERPWVDARPYVEHFRAMWARAFEGFLARRGPEADFIFAPELLSPAIYYGRQTDGREESDRWAQALVLVTLARETFDQARDGARRVAGA
jgi:hypothetical protein